MNPLVLLCTMHADGPSTVRRLQRVGIRTLEQVLSVSEEDLAEHLYGPPSLARRFKKEAETLFRRVNDDDTLEKEPQREGTVELRSAARAGDQGPGKFPGSGRCDHGTPETREWPAGIARAEIDALASGGVGTPEDLVGKVTIDLARTSGIPYPRLMELAYLVQHCENTPQKPATLSS